MFYIFFFFYTIIWTSLSSSPFISLSLFFWLILSSWTEEALLCWLLPSFLFLHPLPHHLDWKVISLLFFLFCSALQYVLVLRHFFFSPFRSFIRLHVMWDLLRNLLHCNQRFQKKMFLLTMIALIVTFKLIFYMLPYKYFCF